MSTSSSNPLNGVNLSDSNLNDHTSLASSLTIVAILFLCLCTMSVSLRVGVRLYVVHGLGLDDCMKASSYFEVQAAKIALEISSSRPLWSR